MEHLDLNQYEKDVTCNYKNETYKVRDNGAVYRHRKNESRLRQLDEQWSFGKPNFKTGYMEIASVRIHRIVATAFHGDPPTKEHVVDHIDTNKHNNRPENLRWVTRFENIMVNPITIKRIESACRISIEEFFENPQEYRELLSNAPTNIQWMRAVSRKEAEASLQNLTTWAKTDKPLLGESLGDWVFRNKADDHNGERLEEIFQQIEKKTGMSLDELFTNKSRRGDYYEARKYAAKLLRSELNLSDYEIGKIIGLSATTVNRYLEVSADTYSGDYLEVREKEFQKQFERTPEIFIQKNWRTQSEFPSCPQKVSNNPIAEYASKLKPNSVFFKNSYYFTTVIQGTVIKNGKRLLVMYEIIREDESNKRWGIMEITVESGKLVHEVITNYNGTSEHYWLIDVENHFKSIIEGTDWSPLYDSQRREFKDDYMPL